MSRECDRELAEEAMHHRAIKRQIDIIRVFLDQFDHCHCCGGQLALDDLGPVHCVDCSADCEGHGGDECTPIYQRHAAARKALGRIQSLVGSTI